MKNRTIKKTALSMAAVICLTVAPQSVIPAKAAPASTYAAANVWVCHDCHNPVTVDVHTIKAGETKPEECYMEAHRSEGCYYIKEYYYDEYWITCSTCNKSYQSNNSELYEKERHLFWYC